MAFIGVESMTVKDDHLCCHLAWKQDSFDFSYFDGSDGGPQGSREILGAYHYDSPIFVAF